LLREGVGKTSMGKAPQPPAVPSAIEADQVDMFAWLGLMLDEMSPSTPETAPKQKSWKDKLDQYVTYGRRKSAMSA
jgi:hypothetical protein